MKKEKSKKIGKILLIFLLFLAVSFIVRAPFQSSTNLDEGIFLSVGERILQGGIPYKTVPESHPPGMLYISAALVALLGNAISNYRTFLTVLTAIIGILLMFLTEKIGKPGSGFFAGLSFSIVASLPVFELYTYRAEILLLPFEVIALYILFDSNKRTYRYVILGLFVGFLPLIKQTAAIFSLFAIAMLLFQLHKKKLKIKNFSLFFVCAAVPSLLVLIYFLLNNAVNDMLYWIVLEPLGFISQTSSSPAVTFLQKASWFLDIMVTCIPLLFLFLISLKYSKLQKEKKIYFLGLIAWGIVIILIELTTNLVPGYHHEYAEILIPLSVASGIGASILFQKIRHEKKVLFAVVFILFIVLWVPLLNITISKYDYTYNNMAMVNSVSQFISSNTPANESTYVFETLWPKNSMNIYFTSDRYPPISEMFFFPPYITANETADLINSLEQNSTPIIVIIGPSPPFTQAQIIYDYITSHYEPVKDFGTYSPLSWLENQSVVAYRLINDSNNS